MHRRTILTIATCLAVLAGVLPMIVLSHVQQMRVLGAERKQVDDYAGWIAIRVNRTLDDAKQALARAETEGKGDCSLEHIRQMGQIVLDAHSIQDIGYFRNGELACTTLGVIAKPTAQPAADMDLGRGYSLTFAVQPELFRSKPLIALHRGRYDALIRSGRLTDLVADAGMTLGVATDQGHVLELSGPADPKLVPGLVFRRRAGMDDRYVLASRRAAGLVTFAFVDRDQARIAAAGDWRDILPLSLVISLALIGIVIWVSRQQLSPEKTLELAIRKRDFVVHYQPIIELSTGRCVAAEALLRWRQRGGAMVPPDLFIPLAEATGLISQLTSVMIEIVMEEMGPLLRSDRHLHISINIPAGDMESGRFLPSLAAAIGKAGIGPAQVWLEVTERGFINAAAVTNAIEAARTAGYRITIDDFGTGYSSLSLLEGLPLDALKIDKAFVDAIGRDAANSVVAPHIIAMAHELKLCMIAEGIETPEQEAYLRNANVQLGQGWLYSKAIPFEQFQAFHHRDGMADQAMPAPLAPYPPR